MSHYTTYVVTKTNDKEELDKLMLPYHEYECTGMTAYCVHVDKTSEFHTDYDKHKADYESPEDFLNSWYGIKSDRIYTEEPAEKPEDSYAVVNNGEVKKVYNFTNPNHKWDYYTPFEWAGCTFVKAGVDVEGVKAIQKSQLDIDTFMDARKKYFSEVYNKLKPYFKPDFISWEDARKQNGDDIPKAREVYNNQQSVKDMMAGVGSTELFHIRWSISVDDIAVMTEEQFVDNNMREAAPFWAIVLPTGEWVEHGHMGWWAVSWDEDKDFSKTWTEIWKKLPDDCYVWRCDCHT